MHSEKKDFEEKTKRFDEMTKRVRKQLIQQRVELELKRQQLESEKEEFAKQQSLINEDTKIIELNVGGEIFMAQKATLARYNHSLLARQLREEAPCQYDKNGRLFIDRNPKTFRLVLDYLRNGSLPAQFTSDEVKRAFEHDMEYFQLGPQLVPFIPLWSKYLKSTGVTISEDGKSAEVSGADGDHLVLLGDKAKQIFIWRTA
ncbi:MAG: hypothetical protein EZS28_021459 [Streblomastix strix]|uniref:Potassium channel tetramerisation-type BTB domain-containing protein n=1 Tax=Streblomastix strix TaxID=222440 RepID=A0A5J4VKL6_9EUKA|nr:MAG: hypothetical protein EZS28_021459 [Streblomastix strix]